MRIFGHIKTLKNIREKRDRKSKGTNFNKNPIIIIRSRKFQHTQKTNKQRMTYIGIDR